MPTACCAEPMLPKVTFKNLGVDDAKERQLRRARDIIRSALKQGFQPMQKVAIAKGLIERRHVAVASALPALRPRFRMQGSATYFTLNDPAHRPPQQIDYDDGLYLPTSFISRNGTLEPVIVAKGLFAAVEEILGPVCTQNGWKLRKEKNSCVRVEIATDAHIDLALYAIPDQEFGRLTEDALASLRKASATLAQDEDIVFSERVYRNLPVDRIMLAQRDGQWIESDPRKLETWFKDAIDEHDEGLRFVCRYVKGWRDYHWENRPLSSIAIMACVVTAYDESRGTVPDDRDDTALLAVAERLPGLLAKEIPNPVIPGQALCEKWTPAERAEFVRLAQQMYDELEQRAERKFPQDSGDCGVSARVRIENPQ